MIEKVLLLDTPGKPSKTLISRRKMEVFLDTLLDTPVFGVGSEGEGVAKKEMARRTGLSVVTVRKYLEMI